MALLFFLLLSLSASADQVYFQMEDPAGDEGVEYPTAPFFRQVRAILTSCTFKSAGTKKTSFSIFDLPEQPTPGRRQRVFPTS